MKANTSLISRAYVALEFLNNKTWANYRDNCLELAEREEREHRGFLPDFRRYHPHAISIRQAAMLFVVKRIAEYLEYPDTMPHGKDYIHTQKSCFYCAALVDEFGPEIRGAWAGMDLIALRGLDYVKFISPEKAA